MATLWRLAGDTPGLKKVAALAVLASLTEGFGIVLLVPILATMTDGRDGMGGLAGWLPALPLASLLGIVLLLVAARLLLRHVLTLEQARARFAVVDRLRHDIYAGLHHAEWRWTAQQRQADNVSVLVTEIGRIAQGLQDAIQLIGMVCSAMIFGLAAFLLSWPTALVAALAGGLVILVSRRQRHRARALGRALGPLNRRVHRTAQEGIQAIRMSKLLGREQAEVAELDDAVGELRAAQWQHLRDNGRAGILGQLAMAALVIGAILFGIEVAKLGVATLLPMVLVIVRIVPALEGLQSGWQHWLEVAPAVDAAHALIGTLDGLAEPCGEAAPAPLQLVHTIKFDDVLVRFEGRETPALAAIDLAIPALCTTAITGPSGAGKSTLADVLMGLIVPDAGLVSIDGVPLSGAMRQQWRTSVAYVEQEVVLRNGSIRDNLTAANPDASEAEIDAALDAASAGFVRALPQRIDSEVGDNGVLLSGGERQRIALARALLRKPQLLILDEATNALDPDNEAAIRAALNQLRGRITIVVISHGSAMIDDVDLGIRLEAGRVASIRDCTGDNQLCAVPG